MPKELKEVEPILEETSVEALDEEVSVREKEEQRLKSCKALGERMQKDLG